MREVDFTNHKCLVCQFHCNNRASLGNHLSHSHKPLTIKDYVLKYFLDYTIPTCVCGCNKNVNWNARQYRFNFYIDGHNKRKI